MPYSALVYREVPPAEGPARATVVALHGANGGLDDLVPLARSLGPNLHVVAPEAARGVYTIRELVAHTWYGGWRIDRPEPASFGDSLAQLERFLYDVRERAGAKASGPPWLLGVDQGAVLALSLAAVVPDLIAGAMAIRGCLPTFSDPTLLEPVASALPILLVADPDDSALPPAEVEAIAKRFAALGATVATTWMAGARDLGPGVTDALRLWLGEGFATERSAGRVRS